jgi:hypothetical protein
MELATVVAVVGILVIATMAARRVLRFALIAAMAGLLVLYVSVRAPEIGKLASSLLHLLSST